MKKKAKAKAFEYSIEPPTRVVLAISAELIADKVLAALRRIPDAPNGSHGRSQTPHYND